MITRLKFFLIFSMLLGTPIAWADAPVTDLTQTQQVSTNNNATTGYTLSHAVQLQQPAESSSTSPPADMNGVKSMAVPATQLPAAGVDTQNLTLSQRVARVEQQMQNLTRMNLPQQITDLQQQVQQLSGQLQVQEHELKVLDQQQRSFYQDLDTQIKQVKSLSSGGSDVNAALPADQGSGSSATVTPGPQKNKKNNPSTLIDSKFEESKAYNHAFVLMRTKKYTQAKQALASYMKQYPKGAYLPNAHFWLGDILLLQKDYLAAKKQFSMIVMQYPHNSKVPDAKLKLAMIAIDKKQYPLARKQLLEIKKSYPNSSAAQLASIELQKMDLIEQTNIE
jgi:tol-pal system protein YbgF